MAMLSTNDRSAIIQAILNFTLSVLLTWWFIDRSQMYISRNQQLLSCVIAGGKWGIQIIAALALLKEKKWQFIREISLACLVGSLILLPYCIVGPMDADEDDFFLGSLVIAVVVMIGWYYHGTRKSGVSMLWWAGGCFALLLLFHCNYLSYSRYIIANP
jgi:hypothetical protein